jgi:Ca2+-dependent lipid-binding protein
MCARNQHACITWQVRRGNNIPKADLNGSCDPYIKLELEEKRFTTLVQYKTLQPVFDESFGFDIIDVEQLRGSLQLMLMDKDKFTRDDELGHAQVGCCVVYCVECQRQHLWRCSRQ